MSKIVSPIARVFTVAAVLGALAFASPSVMANTAASDSPNARMQSSAPTRDLSDSSDASAKADHAGHKRPSAEEMAQRVEARIQNLHDKLKVTPEQESEWNEVAQTMRDNESSMHQAIDARHRDAESMNAIQDLESYQKIAQTHAEGLKKLTSSFQSLYDDMSADQKKVADDAFNNFEGRRGVARASAKHKAGAGAPASPQSE